MIEVRVACSPGEARVAAVEGGVLLDFALWRPGAPDGVGDIHLGRVVSVVPAMAGAFVALADAEGFLPDSEGAKGLTEGTILPVRITRSAQGGKGPRLTARGTDIAAFLSPVPAGLNLDLPSVLTAGSVSCPRSARQSASATGRNMARSAPALISRGIDPLAELAARFPEAPILIDDRAMLASLRLSLGDRLDYIPLGFDDALAFQVEALEQPGIDLPNGAHLSIHPTPALVAIDVDAGGSLASRRGKTAHHEALNEVVLPALAAQIRLRNLSGAIVVDLAGLSVRKRAALGEPLARALAGDPLRPRFLGFTALGLAEIVRPRVRPPLHELSGGPHAAGLAALRAIAVGLSADPRTLPVLRAAPTVIEALQRDPVALPALAHRAGQALILRHDSSLSATGWIAERANG
jgi:Ribonuclease G/E